MQNQEAQEKAKHVGDLLDETAHALQEFQSATAEQRAVLIYYLRKGHGQIFAYIQQMIKTLEEGEEAFRAFRPFIAPPRLKKRNK